MPAPGDALEHLHTHLVLHPVCGCVYNLFILSLFLALACLQKQKQNYATSTLPPAPVRYSYPLHVVVLTPGMNLYTRPLPSLSLDRVSRCAAPTHLLPRFLFALSVLLISCVHVWSRLLSFWLVVYDLLLRDGRELSPECALSEEYSCHNLDEHCLEDTRVVWCLTYPREGTPFLGRYVSW